MTHPANQRIIVAVDGPAGAGKGTICRAIAHQFHMAYLDTGALYRAVALYALEQPLPWQHTALALWAKQMPFSFRCDEQGHFRAWLAETDITQPLREEKVGEIASQLSAIPEIRQALLDFQRHYGQPEPAILDGRDIGTVVWPEAPLKIFLTAHIDERAKRRALELHQSGKPANFLEIRQNMAERDKRDSLRQQAPLQAAPDAKQIDTTTLSIAESIQQVAQWVGLLFQPRSL